MSHLESLHGCLLGQALGDAIGLPFEGLSPQQQGRIWGDLSKKGLEMSLLPGRGMVSDDTEHALFTARALLESRGDAQRFAKSLRSELRGWMFYVPPGVGLATLRAGLKSMAFISITGVWSAGNGPAMRAPILGTFFRDGTTQLREFCQLSTRLTHLDPKAEWGAFAVALAAAEGAQGRCDGRRFVRELSEWSDNSEAAREMLDLAKKAANSAGRGQTSREFCLELGLEKGVSGYIFHTVPVVLQAWLRAGDDFRSAIEEVVLCGGDTDTTAAILGGILGARIGADELPEDWKQGLWEWPNSATYIARVARDLNTALESGDAVVAPRILFGAPFLRNAVFLTIVLTHAARRALPF